MGTLYDLLGALPADDAEGLRTAFRKAAKATHPDLNPDNPEAALRFRQLVRAHDILSDDEQRATYDQLLAIALHPPPARRKRVYEKVQRFASSTIAATIITGVLVASYTLMGLVSRAPVAAESAVKIAARVPSEIVGGGDEVGESRAIAEEIFATGATPAVTARGPWLASADPVPHLAIGDARSPRGFSVSRRDGANLTLRDSGLSRQTYSGPALAYLIGRLPLYAARDVERAFAEMEQARRLVKPRHARTPAPHKTSTVQVQDHPPVRRERMIAAITP
jgi:curved DNA-binding protein CbpA